MTDSAKSNAKSHGPQNRPSERYGKGIHWEVRNTVKRGGNARASTERGEKQRAWI